MLINIKQVAKDFKVSLRTVQMWCKADGIKKIGNEYILTNEIIDRWKIERTKTKEKQTNENASPTKRQNNSQIKTIIITSIILLLLCGLIYYFFENKENYSNFLEEEKQNEIINVELNQHKEKIIKLEKTHFIDSIKYKVLRDSLPKKEKFILNKIPAN